MTLISPHSTSGERKTAPPSLYPNVVEGSSSPAFLHNNSLARQPTCKASTTTAVQITLHVRRLKRVFKDVPGPKDIHWFHGSLHLFPKAPAERIRFMLSLGAMFKRYFCLWIGPARVTLVVNHPDTIKAVMKTSEPKPTGFSGMYRFGIPWLGEGLLISDGERWARNRRLLTPAFHFDILKPYVNVYNEAAEKLMDFQFKVISLALIQYLKPRELNVFQYREYANLFECNNLEVFAQQKKQFEVFSHVSRCTLDIILRCAFSYETDCQAPGKSHPYLKAVSELSDIWWQREKKLLLYPDFIFYMTSMGRKFKKHCDYVHTVAEEVIQKRKAALANSNTAVDRKYMDFLDILLTARDEHGNGMSVRDIRNEVDTFMFEGRRKFNLEFDIFTIEKKLGTIPQPVQYPGHFMPWQNIKSIRIVHKLKLTPSWMGVTLTLLHDFQSLEFLSMCLKESLRNYSPVPFIQREFTRDFELDGRKFPAGTPVALHIYGVHHNRDIWDHPMVYNPERFSRENVAKMNSYQFVPFSAGPRNCIGQHFALNEEKVVIARLLR
ncbi:CP4F6-like protein, partial [Mya arenaria]